MAYPENKGDFSELILDLGSRKEFKSLIKKDGSYKKKNYFGIGSKYGKQYEKSRKVLKLHATQIFVKNFFNPRTPYDRLVLNWQTGAGKTIGAISIAEEYISQYGKQKALSAQERPSVFVITFNRTIFQEELLRHPEFGYINHQQIVNLKRARILAEQSGRAGSNETRAYNGILGTFRRKLTDKTRGGYYQFYGYQEFANKLFRVTELGDTRGFSISKLYEKPDDELEDPEDFVEKIDHAVSEGVVEVNTKLLNSMKGGLIIADEIHNTYNIKKKNDYGVSIQYVLDKLAGDNPPRAVFMTATVVGGSAAEIIDLLNYLRPTGSPKLIRKDFFRIRGGELAALPGAIETIGKLSAGKISYMPADDKSYPRRIFEGQTLYGPDDKKIPFLLFTPCEMSDLHQRTLLANIEEKDGRMAIPTGAYVLYDMVYPRPPEEEEDKPAADEGEGEEEYGLFSSADTIIKIHNAPQAWKNKIGIRVESLTGQSLSSANAVITGDFLKVDNIAEYSGKYYEMIKDILELMGTPGKFMIYHDRVRMSGVLQIQEILKINGFIDELSTPTKNTLCSICGVPYDKHNKTTNHEFMPARFIMVNSNIDNTVLDRSISKYNAASNVNGNEFKILIGSKKIREGYDLKAVKRLFVMSMPTDIPTLIQIFGRTVRKNSHIELPNSERNVIIKIYVSIFSGKYAGKVSPEVARYMEKMEAYKLIQDIERELRRYNINSFVQKLTTEDALDSLRYEPIVSRSQIENTTTKYTTYLAYDYAHEETEEIKRIIYNLFELSPVWTYEDLWAEIKNNPGLSEQNVHDFDEKNYAAALYDIAYHNINIVREYETKYAVSRCSSEKNYYIKTPVGISNLPILDIESYVREDPNIKPTFINLDKYADVSLNFDLRLREFVDKLNEQSQDVSTLLLFNYNEKFHFTLIRKYIENSINKEGIKPAIDFYRKFHIVITCDDLKHVEKNIAGGKKIIGYIDRELVHFMRHNKWNTLPKKAFGFGPRQHENNIIIGYIEHRGTDFKFKIRPPMHVIKAANVKDARSLEKGAVCETRPRKYQNEIARKLGIRDPESLGSIAVCNLIREKLLSCEQKSRDKSMKSGTRWFYLFND